MDDTSTSMYEKTSDWRLKSFGVTGDKNETLIKTLFSARIVKVLLVDVNSAAVCVAFVISFGAPIQVYVLLSTRIIPVHPSHCPLVLISSVINMVRGQFPYVQNDGHCPGR
jgi:hypothetical protein